VVDARIAAMEYASPMRAAAVALRTVALAVAVGMDYANHGAPAMRVAAVALRTVVHLPLAATAVVTRPSGARSWHSQPQNATWGKT